MDDCFIEISQSFSAPKVKLHRFVPLEMAAVSWLWEDMRAGPEVVQHASSYFAKVVQKNGQMAWTSPIWIAGTEDL
jgi:hypothetical protein